MLQAQDAPPPAPAALAPLAPPPPPPAFALAHRPAPPVAVVLPAQGPPFLVRAIWYLFVGSWLGGLALGTAYLLALTVVGLPAALMICNRIGTILTLRPTSQLTTTTYQDGVAIVRAHRPAQVNFLARALYFVFVGWWWAGLWIAGAYAFSLTIVGLPVALWMLNRTGAALTLYRQ